MEKKEVIEKIIAAIPKLSSFQKGRLLGIAEAMEEENRRKKENK